jgi:hypothetical protein
MRLIWVSSITPGWRWCPSQKQPFERWSDRLPMLLKDEGLEMESEA